MYGAVIPVRAAPLLVILMKYITRESQMNNKEGFFGENMRIKKQSTEIYNLSIFRPLFS